MVEYLPSIHEAMGVVSNTRKKERQRRSKKRERERGRGGRQALSLQVIVCPFCYSVESRYSALWTLSSSSLTVERGVVILICFPPWPMVLF